MWEEVWFSISIREITFCEQELNWLFAKYKRLENNLLYGIPLSPQINVVTETRPYPKWTATPTPGAVSTHTGILQAKAELNKLHIQLADQGFNQVGSVKSELSPHNVVITLSYFTQFQTFIYHWIPC